MTPIQFSALAKRKLELLSIHLTIVWGEDTLRDFLIELEEAFNNVVASPTNFEQFIASNLYIYTLSEETSFTYLFKDNIVTVLTLFDSRQNPTIVYNDLIEHFS